MVEFTAYQVPMLQVLVIILVLAIFQRQKMQELEAMQVRFLILGEGIDTFRNSFLGLYREVKEDINQLYINTNLIAEALEKGKQEDKDDVRTKAMHKIMSGDIHVEDILSLFA